MHSHPHYDHEDNHVHKFTNDHVHKPTNDQAHKSNNSPTHRPNHGHTHRPSHEHTYNPTHGFNLLFPCNDGNSFATSLLQQRNHIESEISRLESSIKDYRISENKVHPPYKIESLDASEMRDILLDLKKEHQQLMCRIEHALDLIELQKQHKPASESADANRFAQTRQVPLFAPQIPSLPTPQLSPSTPSQSQPSSSPTTTSMDSLVIRVREAIKPDYCPSDSHSPNNPNTVSKPASTANDNSFATNDYLRRYGLDQSPLTNIAITRTPFRRLSGDGDSNTASIPRNKSSNSPKSPLSQQSPTDFRDMNDEQENQNNFPLIINDRGFNYPEKVICDDYSGKMVLDTEKVLRLPKLL